MEKNTVQLSTEELLLLHSIWDRQKAVNYEIGHLSKELSCRLGTNSDSVSPLAPDNLIRLELVRVSVPTRQCRGFPVEELEITSSGKQVLQQEILAVLASAKERDCRFDLALSASGLVPRFEVLAALAKRRSYLIEVAASLQARSDSRDQPLHLRALFEHPLSLVRCEIEFMEMLIQALTSPSPTTRPC